MRRAGFTIVELAITMSIAMVLLAIGIPQYNRSIQQQEFKEVAVRLQDCIRTAQSEAKSSSGVSVYTDSDIRYSVAWVKATDEDDPRNLSNPKHPKDIRCRVELLPSVVALDDLVLKDNPENGFDDTTNAKITFDTGGLPLVWVTDQMIPEADMIVPDLLKVTGTSSKIEAETGGSGTIETKEFLLIFDRFKDGKLVQVKSNDDSVNKYSWKDESGLKAEINVAEYQLTNDYDFNPEGASIATITIPSSAELASMSVQAIPQ